MNRNRQFWWTVSLSAVVVTLLAFARTPHYSGLPKGKYYAQKLTQSQRYDLIFTGDSRALNGFAPAAMRDSLRDLRMTNLSFESLGYSDEFFQFLHDRLDPKSPHRTVVLAISASTLTDNSVRNNGFNFYRNLPEADLKMMLLMPEISTRFEPVPFSWLYQRGYKQAPVSFTCYYADGWVSKRRVPEDPLASLADHEASFQREKISPAIEETVIRTVRAWQQEGITVYGVRLPTSAALGELENRLSGFDAEEFSKKFVRSGGRWISVNGTYSTGDGGHLSPESALALSKEIATKLAADLALSQR